MLSQVGAQRPPRTSAPCSTAAALLCQQPEQSSAEKGLRVGLLCRTQRGIASAILMCLLHGLDQGQWPCSSADVGCGETAKNGLASQDPSRGRSGSLACRNEHLVNRGKNLAEDKLCWAQAEPAALQV